jgi:hypothetical protein
LSLKRQNWRKPVAQSQESKVEVTQVAEAKIVRLPRKRKGKTSENWWRKAKGLQSKRKKIPGEEANQTPESVKRYWIG